MKTYQEIPTTRTRFCRSITKIAAVAATTILTLFVAGSAVADQPVPIPLFLEFPDVDPCSGDVHTVTITGTTFVHFHNGKIVAHTQRSIMTAPTGYVGHGSDAFVDNGNVVMFRLSDILTNPAGDMFRAKFTIVMDLSTGTVLATNGTVTCLTS